MYLCPYNTFLHMSHLYLPGPDKTDENLPNYPGFEKDVFRVVKEYFCGLKQPLMTYEMYDVITSVFGKY